MAAVPQTHWSAVARAGDRRHPDWTTAKRMFIRALHAVVRETVTADHEVELEIRELKRVLSIL